MLKSSPLLILFILSVANCQFFYNYEENRPDQPLADTQNYDPSAYQYNPPSAVNEQYAQPRATDAEPQNPVGHRRSRIRIRSRSYNSDPDQNQPSEAEYDQRAARQERRQSRRRQRQQDYIQPTLPPRVYSPSIFENVGLGEAPAGVYIPHNSFLNVLRDSPQRAPVSYPVSQPAVAAPQVTNYVQPSVNYVNNNPQPRFFVQPPSNEEPRQTNLILPATRPQIEYAVPTQRQMWENPPVVSPSTQGRSVRTNRQSRQRVRPQARPSQPTVDIDSLREYTDDVNREDIQVMPKVEYVSTTIRQDTRPQNRRRTVTRYQVTPAPRVYSPSAFEKVGLGEAPSGIYVPEDSLLNVLRNPSATSTSVRREPQQLQVQPTYTAENSYIPEVAEEEQYQPPPPPPPPARRPTSQRNRQPQQSRRVESREEYDDRTAVQLVPSSSHRRDEDFEDFARERPPAQRQTQSQRRPIEAPRQQTRSQPRQQAKPQPRQQTQAAPSEREQPTVRKAKLAIAALPEDTDDDGIPGEAGVNYPTLHKIPRTTFSCSQQSHNGYYADLETSCQVVHLCQSGGVQNSFLCPNGTIFSQEKFSCQWWYKVNCSDAPKFYIKNDELYKVPEKKERKRN